MDGQYSESASQAAVARDSYRMNASAILAQRVIAAHPEWSIGAMLLALHAALAWGIAEWWVPGALLAHFGLFLLWQPVWRGESKIELRHALLVALAGFLLAALNNWWLIAVWLAVLFGLIGGSVFGIEDRRCRRVSMLAAFYVLAVLLVWVVPQLFVGESPNAAQTLLVRYGLLAVPVAVMLMPFESRPSEAPVAVDLFYSMLLFLLVVALVLGSFVVKVVAHGDYPIALAQTLFGIALLLVVLSWLWNPHGGFAGVGHVLSRYVMSLGLPFERWVQQLATYAERETQPQLFLAQALQHMLGLPWVCGVRWEAGAAQGELGAASEHNASFAVHGLRLEVATRWRLSPAVLLHLRLLAQMVGYFYDAKRREQLQRQSAYTQAVYETGARLTHDVKNLLQSLRSLCAAAESADESQATALRALMQRQLPQITQRLNATLDKLRSPQRVDADQVEASLWWEGLVQRYATRGVRFTAPLIPKDLKLPAELFDSVADNLIENALAKRRDGVPVDVEAALSTANGALLSVCDTGAPVPRNVAARLFEAAVPSQTGLGIGLFHAAQQAERLGYRLRLAHNESGSVRFVLGLAAALREAGRRQSAG
ncbi:MAG TPA: HAMP domain-containing sensor histidine kinase [Burkholderiales bacterium]|nr:HAMP domain-containing sensor histidine kinase [Burkholderiales bacterium]